ncbi:hypothetical protein CAMRE0001_0383 [Campylobacter rectus RM3267]|uniref:Uncharacterized protein n=1 Tax=Campylobacter rectus RM3267 TaxID=553218 RepID=B9D2F3_CAMRE|nr:hypothetical protein CAMRE0001_0383 [Campylobacter rectus RM3267]
MRHIRRNQPRTPPSLLHRPHKQSHTARHKYGSKSAKSSLQTQISFKILQKSYIFTFFK